MARTLYAVLENGGYVQIDNVTADPVIVNKTIKDAYYRDGGDLTNLPTWTAEILSSMSSGGAVTLASGFNPAKTAQTISDEAMHIPPRQMTYDFSYWDIDTSDGHVFLRWDRVQLFTNVQPPQFLQ